MKNYLQNIDKFYEYLEELMKVRQFEDRVRFLVSFITITTTMIRNSPSPKILIELSGR